MPEFVRGETVLVLFNGGVRLEGMIMEEVRLRLWPWLWNKVTRRVIEKKYLVGICKMRIFPYPYYSVLNLVVDETRIQRIPNA